MNDAGPVRLPHLGELREPGEQAVDQRAVGITRPGMHDQAGRLVDDDEVLVLVDDGEHDSRVGLWCLRHGQQIGVDAHDLAHLQPELADQCCSPSTSTPPDGDERLGVAAAALGDQRDDPVESLAGQSAGDLLGDHAGGGSE